MLQAEAADTVGIAWSAHVQLQFVFCLASYRAVWLDIFASRAVFWRTASVDRMQTTCKYVRCTAR